MYTHLASSLPQVARKILIMNDNGNYEHQSFKNEYGVRCMHGSYESNNLEHNLL